MTSPHQRLNAALRLIRAGDYQETLALLEIETDGRQGRVHLDSTQVSAMKQLAAYLLDPVNPSRGHLQSALLPRDLTHAEHGLTQETTTEAQLASLLLSIGDAVIRGEDHAALDTCERASRL